MIQEFAPVVINDDAMSKNIAPVAQYGFIDLRVVHSTGVVPSNVEDNPIPPNGIEDPASIIGRPDDVFSAHRAIDTYKSAAGSAAPSDVSPEGSKSE